MPSTSGYLRRGASPPAARPGIGSPSWPPLHRVPGPRPVQPDPPGRDRPSPRHARPGGQRDRRGRAGRSAPSTSSRSSGTTRIRDITVETGDAADWPRLTEAVNARRTARGCSTPPTARSCSTRAARSRCATRARCKTRDDLSMAYTPGVARVCEAIADDPDKAFQYTIKRNTVAVVSDGTAVLGLGDIGPRAAMPVMEGKAMLFKEFAGVDAFPICLDTTDPDEIVAVVKAIAPGLRRHQPRGHLGPALLRDRGPAEGRAGHPGLPRRPARHRRRRAGGAAQRADADGPRLEDLRIVISGSARPAWRSRRSCSRRAPATSSAATRAGAVTPSARTIWTGR